MSLQLILAKETQECVGQKLGGSPVRPHVGAVQGARSALFVLLLITPGCGPASRTSFLLQPFPTFNVDDPARSGQIAADQEQH